MLEVIFYESTLDLIKKDRALYPLIICPSPTVADGLRRLLSENCEIITISKWVSDFLKQKGLQRSNKSELMLRLSSVWRHYFQEAESHLFFKAFEFFTDLRSHSLNLEMLSEFLLELDEITARSVLLFWTFLENEKLIDEHLSYKLVSEMQVKTDLWFVGFKHLNGIQIDMLKTLSENINVSLFFPKDIYAETQSSDWIRWLVPESDVIESVETKPLATFIFPKNKLNFTLNAIRHSSVPRFDMALACQQSHFHLQQEVVADHLFFRSQVDVFKHELDKLFLELSSGLKEDLALDSFRSEIEARKKNSLLEQNFKLYKILGLLNEAATAYGEFQSQIDHFSLKVFKTIVELNSPRVYLTTLEKTNTERLFELNELPYRSQEYPLVIIASSHYGSLKSGDGKYTEKMAKALRTIAPVKRAGLDFLFLKSELHLTLKQSNTYLLIEEGLEKIDLAWREILKPFELKVLDPGTEFNLKEIVDHLEPQIKKGPYEVHHFSASRLQSYLDCPRKYYFSYIDKLDLRPEERQKIAPDEMGTIEHEIIQKYFQELDLNSLGELDSLKHQAICKDSLDSFLKSKRIVLDEKTRLLAYFELVHYSQNGIDYLLHYCRDHKVKKLSFEVPLGLNEWSLVGSIDCLIEHADQSIALFDFKRSASAIGSKKETISQEKIQLWVYLLVLSKRNKIPKSWGYLNLSEAESSLIFNEAETAFLNAEVMNEFQQLLEKTIADIKDERDFSPRPRNNKACLFCEVELLCSKGRCS